MPDLKGKTLFISGGSRGIGLAIALRAARDGANVVIAAKTTEPHPKLPGTIYTAAEDIERAGKQWILHRPSELLPAYEQALPSRTLPELKLLDGRRDGAVFFLGELGGRAAGNMESSHAPQRKMREPFSGFGTRARLSICHDAF